MLFNLSQKMHFPHTHQTDIAIQCYSDYGPCFRGGSGGELCAYYEPFNGDNKCVSNAYEPGYKIPL